MTPSEELFDALRFMLIWVKIIGMPFVFHTVAVGRKLLEPMGEVVRMGYFDGHKPEGCYIKGRVRKDMFSPFLGTTSVTREDGSSFQVFFQYEGVPCICYLCGYQGHAMGDCSNTELAFDPLIRDSWICVVTDPNEVETEGPSFQKLIPARLQARRGRWGLPPSVTVALSTNLHRQWAQSRQLGGQTRGADQVVDGPHPPLSLTGPSAGPKARPSVLLNKAESSSANSLGGYVGLGTGPINFVGPQVLPPQAHSTAEERSFGPGLESRPNPK
ncbi:hypothetical protein LINPERPRIM_LOCUS16857 [Linum perenne]